MNTARERKCSTSTRTRNLYSIEIVLAKEKQNAVNMTFGRLFLFSSRRMGQVKRWQKLPLPTLANTALFMSVRNSNIAHAEIKGSDGGSFFCTMFRIIKEKQNYK